MLTTLVRRVCRVVTGREHEGGQALLFVLIAVALLASIPLALATTTVDQLPQTTRNLNYEAAYEAAQAGLNDYIQHLDANEAYGIYCKSCTQGTNGNLAFTSWVQASASPPEYYSYASTDTSGQIGLEVSGKAGTGDGTVVRTFSYSVKPASSLNDVYWSNYETRDPAIGALWPGAPTGYQYCNVHYDQVDPYQADEPGERRQDHRSNPHARCPSKAVTCSMVPSTPTTRSGCAGRRPSARRSRAGTSTTPPPTPVRRMRGSWSPRAVVAAIRPCSTDRPPPRSATRLPGRPRTT